MQAIQLENESLEVCVWHSLDSCYCRMLHKVGGSSSPEASEWNYHGQFHLRKHHL